MITKFTHNHILYAAITGCIVIVVLLSSIIITKEIKRRTIDESVTRNHLKYELLNMANAKPGSQLEKELTARIVQISKPGSSITLENNCEAYPLVLQAKLNSHITISNKASVKQTVVIQGENMPIDAHKKTTFKTDFSQGTGVYGYKCIGTEDLPVNGYIYLVP